MRKTLVAALMVSLGLGSQAFAQHHKEAILNVALNNQAQHHLTGVLTNGIWSDDSYAFIRNCLGTVKYKTENKAKVTVPTLITGINVALIKILNGDYVGKFTSKAQLVVAAYENDLVAPPYPPNMELWTKETPTFLGNVPRFPDYTLVTVCGTTDELLNWPAEYAIAWGYMGEGPDWFGARVFVKDPNNVNPLLRCFDVTPFFSIEEAYCKFCWDVHDRITDGSITAGETINAPPCSGVVSNCGRKGSGTTKFYLTLKYNNTVANPKLNPYYATIFAPAFDLTDITLGAFLSESEATLSANSLIFTVGGIVTYKWTYKALGSGEPVAPIGTMSMPTAQGYGQSPFCGVFWGAVSIVESSQADKGYCFEALAARWQ